MTKGPGRLFAVLRGSRVYYPLGEFFRHHKEPEPKPIRISWFMSGTVLCCHCSVGKGQDSTDSGTGAVHLRTTNIVLS